jgi:hypothetical protein
VDSANLIRDLAVDAEQVLSDRTDAHMNDLVNVRNIPSTATANILMHGDISRGCLRDSSDNLMTNSTAYCFMGVSHENAFILPLVPGNVMTGTCNCNFDICP